MDAHLRLLIYKIERLTPEHQGLVTDFVDASAKCDAAERTQAARRLGDAFKRLDALDEAPMSVEEIEHEIDTMRAERRAHARRS
jgi:uncharacterized protein Yka (UPF0111/DUF47 family)